MNSHTRQTANESTLTRRHYIMSGSKYITNPDRTTSRKGVGSVRLLAIRQRCGPVQASRTAARIHLHLEYRAIMLNFRRKSFSFSEGQGPSSPPMKMVPRLPERKITHRDAAFRTLNSPETAEFTRGLHSLPSSPPLTLLNSCQRSQTRSRCDSP